MPSEPSESFKPLSTFRVLTDDESSNLALILVDDTGKEFRCSLPPEKASDLVAAIIFGAGQRFEKQGGDSTFDEDMPLIPLPVNHLGVTEGRHRGEALIQVAVGQLQLMFASDVDALVSLCVWLTKHLTPDRNAPTSIQ